VKHLRRDLDGLQRQLLDLGARVERAIHDATTALFERDVGLARQVVASEREIDVSEVELEEECLKILALHHPVVGDLRFVIAALKVNNDLERMGDAAESIAVRALQLAELPPVQVPAEFPHMVQCAKGMTRKALECLLQEDVPLARQVLDDDQTVDAAHRAIFAVLQARMRAEPATIEACVLLLSTSRQVERIADLATNIAEDVIFLHDGDIVRHRHGLSRLL